MSQKQRAKLHGILKNGQYQEIPGGRQPCSVQVGNQGQEAYSHNYQQQDHNRGAYRPGGIRSAGQLHIPPSGRFHGDVDTRSHKRAQESIEQSAYVESNPGVGSIQSTHFTTGSVREDPVLDYTMNTGATYYTEHGPRGPLSEARLPPVMSESDTDHSGLSHNLRDHHHADSLMSTLHSVSTPLKFKQLYENDVDNFDSAHNVVIFGADGTGKTTIINHFFNNPNISELDKRCKTDGVSIIVLDSESKTIMRIYILEAEKHDMTEEKIRKYEQCEVAVMVYDISSYDSLKQANKWITKIQQHINGHLVKFMLVGNKYDMIAYCNESLAMMKGVQLATDRGMAHSLISAKDGLNMNKLLDTMATLCLAHNQSNAIESKVSYLEKRFEEQERRNKEKEKADEERCSKLEQTVQQLLQQQRRQEPQERRGKTCMLL